MYLNLAILTEIIIKMTNVLNPDQMPNSPSHSASDLDPNYLTLALSPPNQMSYAKFLFCFNSQSASLSFKIGENVV